MSSAKHDHNSYAYPGFTIGILADVQYAGRHQNENFRDALNKLRKCVDDFNGLLPRVGAIAIDGNPVV